MHREDLLDARRRKGAAVGLVIRPRMPTPTAPAIPDEQSPETSTPETPERLTPCRILYLRTTQGQQGVLQIHQVSRLFWFCYRASSFFLNMTGYGNRVCGGLHLLLPGGRSMDHP